MDLTVAEHISYVLTINTVYKTTKSLHYIIWLVVCVCVGGVGVGLSMSESKHQMFFIFKCPPQLPQLYLQGILIM